MKNGYKYKIDVNHHSSRSHPVALYRWEPSFPWGRWVHEESFQTQDDARKHYDAIADQIGSLPVYL